jgi:hypothetical protein
MIRHAAQMGVNKGELIAYLRKLGLLPRQIDTRLTLQHGATPRTNLQAIADALANLHDKTVTVNVVPGGRYRHRWPGVRWWAAGRRRRRR